MVTKSSEEIKTIDPKRIETELSSAQEYLQLHPILSSAPHEVKDVEDYLLRFTSSEREIYRSYYADEM